MRYFGTRHRLFIAISSCSIFPIYKHVTGPWNNLFPTFNVQVVSALEWVFADLIHCIGGSFITRSQIHSPRCSIFCFIFNWAAYTDPWQSLVFLGPISMSAFFSPAPKGRSTFTFFSERDTSLRMITRQAVTFTINVFEILIVSWLVL